MISIESSSFLLSDGRLFDWELFGRHDERVLMSYLLRLWYAI